MWLTFFVAMLIAGAFLYVPGFFFLRAFRVRSTISLCCAPVFTVVAYFLITCLLSALDVFASWTTVALPVIVFAVVLAALSHSLLGFRGRCLSGFEAGNCGSLFGGLLSKEWVSIVLYILIGLTVVGIVFIKNLDGPDSFLQAWDNSHHLSSIRAFLESGDYSMLSTSLYAAPSDRLFTPFPAEGNFYPSAWHCLAALVVSATGASVSMAANAVNALIVSVVLPLSLFLLMNRLFLDCRSVVICGSVVSLASATFPWGFLTFGPLYPNLLSYALLPISIVLFLSIFDEGVSRSVCLVRLIFFAVSVVSLACSQPNAVFSAIVFLAPFCVAVVSAFTNRIALVHGWSRAVVYCSGFLCAAVIVGVWFILFNMPFLQGVIWFDWPAKENTHQALVNIATMSFSYAPAQIPLAFFAFAGTVSALADSRFRWFACSFLLACAICFVDLSCNGFVKHLLAGFWYTDQLRTASMAALFCVPMAALGLRHAIHLCVAMLSRCIVSSGGRSASSVMSASLLFLVGVALFYPSYDIPGHHHVETGLGEIRDRVEKQNSVMKMNYLDIEEKAFVKRAMDIVGTDEPVINSPDDGSVFLYGYEGMRTYYRSFTGYSPESGESEVSRIIRTSLYKVAEDEKVSRAVDDLGVEYVLLLDYGKDEGLQTEEERRRFILKDGVDNEIWSGIRAISDETPGFEVVLSEGDMRLYRITV